MNLNLVVVDDDRLFNQMISTFLANRGMRVASLYSLAEAKSYVSHSEPDFILLDIILEDGMGIDLLDYIPNTSSKVPIMMITAKDDQDTMQSCFRKGVDDYLIKPLNLDLMWLKIERLYRNSQLQQQVLSQSDSMRKLLNEMDAEEQLARHVYEYLAGNASEQFSQIHSLLRSSSAFNGDIFVACKAPNGNVYSILLDATGHGLVAAISVLPLLNAFPAMVRKGLDLALIAYELNQKLNLSIPDDRFVAGILLCLDIHTQKLGIWNGGMPDLLVLDNNGKVSEQHKSKHMPLGIAQASQFDATLDYIDVSDNASSLVLFSDGLIEQTSMDGEFFGLKRLIEIIENNNTPEGLIDVVERSFDKFRGVAEQSDDVSICVIDLVDLIRDRVQQVETNHNESRSQIHMDINISGSLLNHLEPMALINSMMGLADVPVGLRQKAYTVCAELVSNAIDHGVLRLSSELKNDTDGFAEYLNQRDKACQSLTVSDFIKLSLLFDFPDKHIHFQIEDSGKGFDPTVQHNTQDALSGRGLILIDSLSDAVKRNQSGTKTAVVIK